MMHNSSLLSSPPPPLQPQPPSTSSLTNASNIHYQPHSSPGSSLSSSSTSNVIVYNNINSTTAIHQPSQIGNCPVHNCSNVKFGKFTSALVPECKCGGSVGSSTTPLTVPMFPTGSDQCSMESTEVTNRSGSNSACSHGASNTSGNLSYTSSSSTGGISRDIRNIRNQAEKQRRDKLNGYINELAENVPFIKQSNKRQDKTAILRLAAAYIRFMKRFNRRPTNLTDLESGSSSPSLSPYSSSGGGGGSSASPGLHNSSSSSKSSSANQTDLKFIQKIVSNLPESIDSFSGFSLFTNCQGKILHVSGTIEKYLGHHYTEVLGHTLNNFLHPNDTENVRNVINSLLEQLHSSGSRDSKRVTFHCRLREKNQPRSDSISYQTVRVSGHLTSDYCNGNKSSLSGVSRRRVSKPSVSAGSPSPGCTYNSKCYQYCSSAASSSCSSSVANSPVSGTGSGSVINQPPPTKLLRTYSQGGSSNAGNNGFTDAALLSPMSAGTATSEFHYPICDDISGYSGAGVASGNVEDNNNQQSATVCSPGGVTQTTSAPPPTLSSIIFLCFVEVIPTNPATELKLVDANFDEYISRHALDGTLLYADHRISSVIGFFPNEVYGKSAYDFILPDDHSIAIFAHKLMLSNSNGTGVVVHRLRAVDDSVVFLQTAGCLQYNSSGQIDHFMCVSRMLVESEGDKERDKFVKRFTPHIHNQSSWDLYESLQLVINPYNTSTTDFMPPQLASPSMITNRQIPARFERLVRAEQQPPTEQSLETAVARAATISPPQYTPPSLSLPADGITEISPPNVIQIANALSVQSAIKKLEAHSELLFSRGHPQQPYGLPETTRPSSQVIVDNPNYYLTDTVTFGYPRNDLEQTTQTMEAANNRSAIHNSGDISGTCQKRPNIPLLISLSSSGLPLAKKSKVEPGGGGPNHNQWSVNSAGLSNRPADNAQSGYSSTKPYNSCKIEEAVKIDMSKYCSGSSSGSGSGSQPNPTYSFVAPSTEIVPCHARANIDTGTKYQIAHGQRDYTHLLGARVLTYDTAQQAKVLSIYTPPAALNAKQKANNSRRRNSINSNANKGQPTATPKTRTPTTTTTTTTISPTNEDNSECNPRQNYELVGQLNNEPNNAAQHSSSQSSTQGLTSSSNSSSAPSTLTSTNYHSSQHYHHHHHVHVEKSSSVPETTTSSSSQPSLSPPLTAEFRKQSESNKSTKRVTPSSTTTTSGDTNLDHSSAPSGLTSSDSSHSYYHHHHHYFIPQTINSEQQKSKDFIDSSTSELFVPIESLKQEIEDDADEPDTTKDDDIESILNDSSDLLTTPIRPGVDDVEDDDDDQGKLTEEMEQTCDNLGDKIDNLNECGSGGHNQKKRSDRIETDDRSLRSTRNHQLVFDEVAEGMVDFSGDGDDLIDSSNELSFSFLPVISANNNNSQFELDQNKDGSNSNSNPNNNNDSFNSIKSNKSSNLCQPKVEDVDEEDEERMQPPPPPPPSAGDAISYPYRFDNIELPPIIDHHHHHLHHSSNISNKSGSDNSGVAYGQRSTFKSGVVTNSTSDPNGTNQGNSTTTSHHSGNQNLSTAASFHHHHQQQQQQQHQFKFNDPNNNRIGDNKLGSDSNNLVMQSGHYRNSRGYHHQPNHLYHRHSDWLDQVDNVAYVRRNICNKEEFEMDPMMMADGFVEDELFYSSSSVAPSSSVNYLTPVSHRHHYYNHSIGHRSRSPNHELLYDHLEQSYSGPNFHQVGGCSTMDGSSGLLTSSKYIGQSSVRPMLTKTSTYPVTLSHNSNEVIHHGDLGEHEDSIDLASLDIDSNNWYSNNQINLNVPFGSHLDQRKLKSETVDNSNNVQIESNSRISNNYPRSMNPCQLDQTDHLMLNPSLPKPDNTNRLCQHGYNQLDSSESLSHSQFPLPNHYHHSNSFYDPNVYPNSQLSHVASSNPNRYPHSHSHPHHRHNHHRHPHPHHHHQQSVPSSSGSGSMTNHYHQSSNVTSSALPESIAESSSTSSPLPLPLPLPQSSQQQVRFKRKRGRPLSSLSSSSSTTNLNKKSNINKKHRFS